MSRGMRRERGSGIDVFSQPTTPTAQDASDAIFNLPGEPDQRTRVKFVSIFEIYPDLTQPRRAVPSTVRHHWSGEPDGLRRLFDLWVRTIQQERGDPNFDLYDYLNQKSVVEEPEGIDAEEMPIGSPTERALFSLAQLAVSIKTIGLTNAITLAETGATYRLETGERRWMAFHLLNHYADDDKWTKIPARTFATPNIWRQAAENSARADLNAIAKARQLAILLMHVIHEKDGTQFQSYDAIINSGRSEREYYAQVADGKIFRIPSDQTEKLLTATGLKHPSQIRQYRMLLRKTDEEWTAADDYDLTEWEIRNGKLEDILRRNDPPQSVTGRNGMGSKEDEPINPFVESINKNRHTKIWTYANRLDTLTDEQRKQAIDDIQAEKRWLEELERALENRSRDD